MGLVLLVRVRYFHLYAKFRKGGKRHESNENQKSENHAIEP